jgi:hypothetical protein
MVLRALISSHFFSQALLPTMVMSVDSAQSSVALAPTIHPVPNNLGPTLLLVVGFLMAPLLIGVPLLLLGLSMLRSADGTPALPSLARSMGRWAPGPHQPSDCRRIGCN